MRLLGPLFWYELRRLPRRRQMHLWRVLYAGALLFGLVVVYLRSFHDVPPLEALANPGTLDAAGNAAFAETFLMAFLAVQQLAVIVLTPLYAAGGIADEKEHHTLDFLLSSPLPHYQILLGKLMSRLVYVGSIIAVGLPVLALTFLFGGVDFEHLLAGFAMTAITAVFLGNLGVMFACVKKNLRETLPGIVLVLLAPALIGLCGGCLPEIAAASPITVLGFLFRTWLIGDPSRDITWSLVGIFAALHLPPSVLLFFTAKMAMGEKPLPAAETEYALAPAQDAAVRFEVFPTHLRRTYDVRPLRFDEDPLAWKERSFHLPWFSPERGCSVMAVISVVAGVVFIALFGLFVIMVNDLASGRSLDRTTNTLALIVFVPTAALGPAFLGARVAASLGRERAGQTLLTLFTLPVERTDILKAIVLATLHRARWLAWFLGGVLALRIVAGGVDWRGALGAIALLFGCGAWAIAFGLWLSVQVETPTRASLIFLAVWMGVLLLPWFAAPFVGPDWRDAVEMVCPPHGMLEAFPWPRRGETGEGLPVRVAFLTGLGLTALAAAFGWHALRTFEREGK